MRTKRWMVVAATALLLTTSGVARATGGGLVIDDRAGDSPPWADLTQFRMETVLDGSAQPTGLRLTFRTDEAPGDDDVRRPWFFTGWHTADALQSQCRAELGVFSKRQGPEGWLKSRCDGDPAETAVSLGAADVELDAVPGSNDFLTTVTISFAALAGQAGGRYATGTVLEGIAPTSGVTVADAGVTTDLAGDDQPPTIEHDDDSICVCWAALGGSTYEIGT